MRTRAFVTLSILLLGVCGTGANGNAVSGQAGVYAVVQRVVFEPPTGLPQRIQIWGAFALMERIGDGFTSYAYTKPALGYMYFQLPSIRQEDIENTRREWNDLASVAGKKQAVAFGFWNNREGDKMPAVRNAELTPQNPDTYRMDIGLTKLTANTPGPVAALLKLAEIR
jgi:hypothetical protein